MNHPTNNLVGWINNKLDEIDQLADRVTVLRDGDMVGTSVASELSRDEMIRHLHNCEG